MSPVIDASLTPGSRQRSAAPSGALQQDARRRQPLIRRHSPSKDGRLSTPYGATFSREREKGRRVLSAHCENVLQEAIWPLFKPVVSHFARAADEPCVKLSGTA